ncbi:MAG TPA: GntR family transcriptional regulator [Solirubrobacteraceae bacterium]|jgi:DNA-binding GntR family transcriptional regulator|nr:GntR family transcriptional regulator [Solirubrobacteraceae bacterium]
MDERRPVVALRSSPSLVDIAHEAIVEAIVQRHFEAGKRVTIDQIAHDLSMSITPVREALMQVAADGLLIQSRNRGFAVAPLLTFTTYHQLFAMRRLLETNAVGTAVVTDGDLLAISATQAKMDALEPSTDYSMYHHFNQLDETFHRQVVMLAGNPFLTDAWNNLHFHIQISRLYAGQGVIDHENAHVEHAEIVDALAAGRLDEATNAVQSHIAGAETRLIHLLPPAEPPIGSGPS